MINDFVLIERLFGRRDAVMFVDEVLEHYSKNDLHLAIKEGYLTFHRICLGPDCGRHVCWLSDSGRSLMNHSLNRAVP